MIDLMIVDHLKRFAVAIAGMMTMVAAMVWNLVDMDANVPNDANIGAGLLFMAGIAIVIVGLALVWSRRNDTSPPPPVG